MWKTLKKITGYKTKETAKENPEVIIIEGKRHEGHKEIVEAFNRYYINMSKNLKNEFENIQGRQSESENEREEENTEAVKQNYKLGNFQKLDARDIKQIISSLKENTAAGADQMPSKY